jgi:hypothetical protein
MDLPNNYYRIEFQLSTNSLIKSNLWNTLKHNCENIKCVKERTEISEKWISNCYNKFNKNFIYNTDYKCIINKDYKKIKFRETNIARYYGYGGDNLIIFDIINGNKYNWKLEEIDDLINGFIKTCNQNKIINVRSYIKLINNTNTYIINKKYLSYKNYL